jgi:hypothetical protein
MIRCGARSDRGREHLGCKPEGSEEGQLRVRKSPLASLLEAAVEVDSTFVRASCLSVIWKLNDYKSGFVAC